MPRVNKHKLPRAQLVPRLILGAPTGTEPRPSALDHCPICQESTVHSMLVFVPCDHGFCTPCATEWRIYSHGWICPVCRAKGHRVKIFTMLDKSPKERIRLEQIHLRFLRKLSTAIRRQETISKWTIKEFVGFFVRMVLAHALESPDVSTWLGMVFNWWRGARVGGAWEAMIVQYAKKFGTSRFGLAKHILTIKHDERGN